MKELGSDELELHAEAGRYARAAGIDLLMSVGTLAAHAAVGFGENAVSYTSKEALADALVPHLNSDHTILFKGSRGARMEEVISLLIESENSAAVSSDTDAERVAGGSSASTGMPLQDRNGVSRQAVCP